MASKKPLVLDSAGRQQQIQAGDSIPVSAGGTGATDAAGAKTNLALNNVENKSSSTIRGELTSTNVTDALGFTPAASGGGKGTVVVDFGSGNGSQYTFLAVSVPSILAGALIEAWIFPIATADHNELEHIVDPPRVMAGVAVAGVGFTIHAFSTNNFPHRGAYTVAWAIK